MAYNVPYNVNNQEDFNKLHPEDKIIYLAQNQNSDVYKNELNRTTGILGENPSNVGAQDWYSRITAANAGVDPNAINGNTYDKSKYQYQNNAFGTGIRDTMVNGLGLDNSKIGWNSDPTGLGTVTYDGKDFMKASALNNGTSYANNVNDIYKAAVDYSLGTDDPYVDLTAYAATKGLPFNVGYQNGVVTVGGATANPSFVIDGNAYIKQSELDALTSRAMQNANIQNNADIWQKYEDKYTPLTDALLDKIVNREAFDYDPESDVAYQAYRDQYNREGDKALRDTMGSMAGLTGGFVNSAAVTAGAQAEQQWKDALMDRIPELVQQAYSRYVDDYNMNRTALSDVQNQHATAFNREYGVNRDTIEDVRYNNQLDTARNDKVYERNWAERQYNDEQTAAQKQWDRENQWHEEEQDQWQKQFELQKISYDQQKKENALTNAQNRGWFTQEEADLLGVPLDADPYYYTKTSLQIQNDSNKDYLAYQYALQDQYDEKAAARSARYASSGRSSSSGGSSSGTKKVSVTDDDEGGNGGSGISATAQQLHDETDAWLRSTTGKGINEVSALEQAKAILYTKKRLSYSNETVDELMTAAAIPDDVITAAAAAVGA